MLVILGSACCQCEVRPRSARLNSLTSIVLSSKEKDSSGGQLVKEYPDYCHTLDMKCEYLVMYIIIRQTISTLT